MTVPRFYCSWALQPAITCGRHSWQTSWLLPPPQLLPLLFPTQAPFLFAYTDPDKDLDVSKFMDSSGVVEKDITKVCKCPFG